MKMKRIIRTNNKEIYNKLNMLTFNPEIILKDVKVNQINKIISNINKNGKVVEVELIGDYFLIRKKQPVNFSIYFNNN